MGKKHTKNSWTVIIILTIIITLNRQKTRTDFLRRRYSNGRQTHKKADGNMAERSRGWVPSEASRGKLGSQDSCDSSALCLSVHSLENGKSFQMRHSGTRADFFLSVKGLLHAFHWSHSETLSGRKELNYQLGLLLWRWLILRYLHYRLVVDVSMVAIMFLIYPTCPISIFFLQVIDYNYISILCSLSQITLTFVLLTSQLMHLQ